MYICIDTLGTEQNVARFAPSKPVKRLTTSFGAGCNTTRARSQDECLPRRSYVVLFCSCVDLKLSSKFVLWVHLASS